MGDNKPELYGIFLNRDKDDTKKEHLTGLKFWSDVSSKSYLKTELIINDKQILQNKKYYPTYVWFDISYNELTKTTKNPLANYNVTPITTYLVNVMIDIPVTGKFTKDVKTLKENNNIVLHLINEDKSRGSLDPRSVLIKISFDDFKKHYDIIQKHVGTNYSIREPYLRPATNALKAVKNLGVNTAKTVASAVGSIIPFFSKKSSAGGTKKRKHPKKAYSRRKR